MFEHAYLKIERAEKHIQEFQLEVARFIKENPHSIRVESNSETRHHFLHVVLTKAIPTDTSPIIGDAIHNLRSALDLAWHDVVSMFALPDEYTKFPFRETRQEVAAALNGRKIPPSCGAISDFVMDVVKPYKGGNDTLWLIHYFDIVDKHRFLIPNFRMTAISNISVECDGGTAHTFPLRAIRRGFPTVFTCRGYRNVSVTDEGDLAHFVLFDQGPLYRKPVEKSLIRFKDAVVTTVDGFRQLIDA